MSTTSDPIIRRRPDGSIDVDHYDRIARRLRARDQRARLARLITPTPGLIGAQRSGSSTQQPSADDPGESRSLDTEKTQR